MNLSKNFTLQELIKSQTATRKNIEEQFTPSQTVVENLKQLIIIAMILVGVPPLAEV